MVLPKDFLIAKVGMDTRASSGYHQMHSFLPLGDLSGWPETSSRLQTADRWCRPYGVTALILRSPYAAPYPAWVTIPGPTQPRFPAAPTSRTSGRSGPFSFTGAFGTATGTAAKRKGGKPVESRSQTRRFGKKRFRPIGPGTPGRHRSYAASDIEC